MNGNDDITLRNVTPINEDEEQSEEHVEHKDSTQPGAPPTQPPPTNHP